MLVIDHNAPMKEVVQAVAAVTGIPAGHILGRSRKREIAHARQQVMYLCHVSKGRSLGQIGRFLKRDHTTVLHGIRAEAERRGE